MNKFHEGEVVRYGSGELSIMMIDNLILHHSSDNDTHYYGINAIGQPVSVPERHCKPATEADKAIYQRQRNYQEE